MFYQIDCKLKKKLPKQDATVITLLTLVDMLWEQIMSTTHWL